MKAVAPGIVLAAAVLLPVLARLDHPLAYAGGRRRDEVARAARNTSAAAALLGELRTAAADILFIKTERYLHSGVSYLPHLDEALLSVTGTTQAMDEHQRDVAEDPFGDHEGVPTTIPDPSSDFRGWIGRMHRAVHPWKDPSEPHQHTDGTELLPWFRIMTLADPRNVRGFAVGSWWLKAHRPDHAEGFLREGLEHNPDAFTLHLMLGQVLLSRARELGGGDLFHPSADAASLLDRARITYGEAARLAVQSRPPDFDPEGEDLPRWTRYDENDALAAVHMAVLTERQYGDPGEARRLATQYLDLFPRSATLRRVAQP